MSVAKPPATLPYLAGATHLNDEPSAYAGGYNGVYGSEADDES
jgi:hypothetical protein